MFYLFDFPVLADTTNLMSWNFYYDTVVIKSVYQFFLASKLK